MFKIFENILIKLKKVNWLYKWILALATFVKHLCKRYNNKKVTKNINIRQNTNLK